MVQVTITSKELNNDNGGGGLEVIIPGAEGDPTAGDLNCPLFVEYYNGELRVVIWDGSDEPQIIPIKNFKPKSTP